MISLGGIVVSQSIRIGGDELDEAIINYVKREYKLMIGQQTSEEVKLEIGSAFPLDEEVQAEIRGRDLVSGLPKTIVLTSEEVRMALEEPLQQIIDAVKETLDRTPPELASDIMDRGIMLAGGGALQGLDERLRDETQMPAHLAESPLTCVAVGSGRSLEEFEAIHRANKNSRTSRAAVTRESGRRPAPLSCTTARRSAGGGPALAVFVASIAILTAYFGESGGGFFHALQRGARRPSLRSRPAPAARSSRSRPLRLGRRHDRRQGSERGAPGGRPPHQGGRRGQTAQRDAAQLKGLVGLQKAEELSAGHRAGAARVIAARRTSGTRPSRSTRGSSDGIAWISR